MSLATLLEAARYLEQQERSPAKPSKIEQLVEEEPSCAPVTVPHNGIRIGPPPPSAPIPMPTPPGHVAHVSPLSALPSLLTDSGSELPRARSNSNGSSGLRAAGTREVHNKLEKNRRAHLKECFEALRLQLPASADDKKSSNLSILDSAIKYIQALKRRDKELEHEMERLAREKIAHQQKLSSLRRDSPAHQRQRHPTNHDRESSMEVDEAISSRISPMVLNAPSNASISISHNTMEIITQRTSPPNRLSPPAAQMSTNASLDLTTRPSRLIQTTSQQMINLHASNGATIYPHLGTPPPHSVSVSQRPQSTQIIGSFPHHIPNGIVASPKSLNFTVNPSIQNVRSPKVVSVASDLPTLTVTTVNPGPIMTVNQGQTVKQAQIHAQSSVMTSGVNGQTALVHPAQLQLSQMMNGSGLVPTIQLFSTTPQGLRVVGGALASIDLPSTAANSPIQRMRDVQKIGEPSVGVSGANGTVRAPGERTSHHHIAIKPQPGGNVNTSLRTTNPQSIQMMNGLTPLVVSQGGAHLMTAPSHITGKVMSGSIMKAGVGQHIPLAVNTQYLSAATLVKPVVVVSTSNGVPPSSSS